MTRRIYRHFSKPVNLAILNAVLIAIIVVFNIYLQAFCIPTTWATITLAVCFINTILYPILEKTKLAPVTAFINGITVFVFVYCVLFLEHMNFLGLIVAIIGIGLVTFIPHFFIAQLIWKNLFRPAVQSSRYYFIAAMLLCSLPVAYVRHEYKDAINSIQRFESSGYKELEKTFMTEKILGMHFIYHTQICEFDGWRPPKHEPALVIGMWLNNKMDPLQVDLKTRLELYIRFFPERKYKFDCSCAIKYSEDYHNDKFWK